MIPIPDSLIARSAPMPPGEAAGRHRADETAATEAYTLLFIPKLRELTRAFYATQGHTPTEDLPATRETGKALLAKAQGDLDGETRKKLFGAMANRTLADEFDRMGRHAMLQDQLWRNQVSRAFLDLQISNTVEYWNDGTVFSQSLKNGLHEISAFGLQEGDKSENIIRDQAEFLTNITITRLMMMAHHDCVAANSFYENNKKQISFTARPGVEDNLDRVMTDTLVELMGHSIVAGLPPDGSGIQGILPTSHDPGQHLNEWLNQADEVAKFQRPGDEKFRVRLRREVAARVASLRADQQTNDRRTRNILMRAVLGFQGSRPQNMRQLLGDPNTHLAWVQAPEHVRDAVEQCLANHRHGLSHEPNSDARPMAQVLNAMGLEHPAGFRRIDLSNPVFHALSAKQHLNLVQAQDDEPNPQDQHTLSRLCRKAGLGDENHGGFRHPALRALHFKGALLDMAQDEIMGGMESEPKKHIPAFESLVLEALGIPEESNPQEEPGDRTPPKRNEQREKDTPDIQIFSEPTSRKAGDFIVEHGSPEVDQALEH